MHLFPQLLNSIIDIIPDTLDYINFILVILNDFILLSGLDCTIYPPARIPLEFPQLVILFIHNLTLITIYNMWYVSILPTILHKIQKLQQLLYIITALLLI